MKANMRFSEFWLLYLAAHRRSGTRAAHYFATLLGAAAAVFAVHQGEILYMIAGIAAAYTVAIASHRLIEGNQPLIRVNALYGAVSDLKMCWLAARGRLNAEYVRLNLADNNHEDT